MQFLPFVIVALTQPANLQAQVMVVPPHGTVSGDAMVMPADQTPSTRRPPAAPLPAAPVTGSLPSLDEPEGWPEPIEDSPNRSFFLIDLLEYRESREPGTIRWDAYGWYGGDVKRVWFKTEGTQSTASGGGGEQEAQLLYGQLISPFFDLQAGVRVANRSGPGPDRQRAYAVIGLQGLAPYRYELEPSLFISQDGKVSARVTATYDQLLTQTLILQPRLEVNVAAQTDRDFNIGSGLSDTEVSLRLRYEVRREFAPYVGVSWKQVYGSTKRLVRAEGDATSVVSLVAGVRMWF